MMSFCIISSHVLLFGRVCGKWPPIWEFVSVIDWAFSKLSVAIAGPVETIHGDHSYSDQLLVWMNQSNLI